MIYDIIVTITLLLAVWGLFTLVRSFFDMYTLKKCKVRCKIEITECKAEYAEYAIRFLESRFMYGECGRMFENLTLGKDVCIKEECKIKLENEFRNIK